VKAPEVFVAGLHLRWDGVCSVRIICSRGSRAKLPVIVVEEPHGATEDRDELRTAGQSHGDRPLRRRGWGEPLVDAEVLDTARA